MCRSTTPRKSSVLGRPESFAPLGPPLSASEVGTPCGASLGLSARQNADRRRLSCPLTWNGSTPTRRANASHRQGEVGEPCKCRRQWSEKPLLVRIGFLNWRCLCHLRVKSLARTLIGKESRPLSA